jgi:hypothetical protein
MSRFLDSIKYRSLWTSLIPIILLLSLLLLDRYSGSATQGGGQAVMTGSENHSISLSDAISLTHNFRLTAATGSPTAEAFGKNAVREVLDQVDCVGLKIYFGRRDDGAPTLVLVGVSSSGADMINGKILDTAWPCPPFCDLMSPLAQ